MVQDVENWFQDKGDFRICGNSGGEFGGSAFRTWGNNYLLTKIV